VHVRGTPRAIWSAILETRSEGGFGNELAKRNIRIFVEGVSPLMMRALLSGGVIAALAFVMTLEAQQPRTVDAAVLKAAGTANDPMPGTWLSYGRTQGETRYSPLNQINASNAGKLGLSWSYVVGAGGGNQEGT